MNYELLKLEAYSDIFKVSVDLAVIVEKHRKILRQNGMSDDDAKQTIIDLVRKSDTAVATLSFDI